MENDDEGGLTKRGASGDISEGLSVQLSGNDPHFERPFEVSPQA